MNKTISRRRFLANSAAGASLTFAVPNILSARSPNETVRVAGVGVGGKGWTDINGAAGFADVVAYCDVARKASGRKGGFGAAAKSWPKAAGYADWRKLLDKEHKRLDGITVSTPDHMHAPITMTAMEYGLAVYTQKPLTRTVAEARALRMKAAETRVATQMGNQHHNGLGYRTLVKAIRGGMIGKVRAAHSWSNRPIWPQGIDRPAGSDPIPEGLDWNLWLGVAQERPFKSGIYHPFKWRGWFDFGAGALGDMGCHIIDPVVWALELGPAKSVAYDGPKPKPETFPKWEVLTYAFPGTKHTASDEITLKWYDGGKKPTAKSTDVRDDSRLPSQGAMFVGETGTLVCAHGKSPQIYRDGELSKEAMPDEKSLNHYQNWTDGIRGNGTPTSNFDYAGPLTETVLLGVIASRIGEGTLNWDSQKMQFTNSKAANQFVKEDYREGWEVKGL